MTAKQHAEQLPGPQTFESKLDEAILAVTRAAMAYGRDSADYAPHGRYKTGESNKVLIAKTGELRQLVLGTNMNKEAT